jgi:hypothetical protein
MNTKKLSTKFITDAQARALVGISRNGLYAARISGRIPSIQATKRCVLYLRKDVERFAASRASRKADEGRNAQ